MKIDCDARSTNFQRDWPGVRSNLGLERSRVAQIQEWPFHNGRTMRNQSSLRLHVDQHAAMGSILKENSTAIKRI